MAPTESSATGSFQTLLPTSSAGDISPSVSRQIIITSVGVGGLVVLLVGTALIVISVLVCLRKKRKNHHINNTDSATYQSHSIMKSETIMLRCNSRPISVIFSMQPTMSTTLMLSLPLLQEIFVHPKMMHMVYYTKKLLLKHPLFVKEQSMRMWLPVGEMRGFVCPLTRPMA